MIPVFPFAALPRKLSFTTSQPTVTDSPLGIANTDDDDVFNDMFIVHTAGFSRMGICRIGC